MRRLLLVAFAVALAAVIATPIRPAVAQMPADESQKLAAAPAAAVTVAPAALADDLVTRLNAERRANGLSELAVSPDAYTVALERATDMATNDYFAHASPSGVSAVDLLARHGVKYGWMGENIARTNYPAAEMAAVVHDAWLASPGHRENMLAPVYGHVGIAVVSAGDMFFIAEIFLD